MKLTFVIPVYNEERLVEKCINSILHNIHHYPHLTEVIVVNNASTDNTVTILEGISDINVIHENKKGLTHARHAGYSTSTGDLIANIDADTMISPEWIMEVYRQFSAKPHLVALSGPFVYYDLPWYQRVAAYIFYFFGYIVHLFNQHILGKGAMLQGGNFVLRRDALESIGGFDTSIAFYGEDTDIARRISKVGTVIWTWKLPIYASGRRITHEGLLRTGLLYAVNYFSTLFTGRPATRTYTDVRPHEH